MHDRNSLDELSQRFPTRFVWGVASSAFQIEGASAADGKGASIWDEFCRCPGVTADGSDGTIACDHYHRLESDLNLIADLGVSGYRFSISWPRIQPTGDAAVSEPGLDFYSRLVDGLLKRGIEPYATLYHWDLPAALQNERDGWAAVHRAPRHTGGAGSGFGRGRSDGGTAGALRDLVAVHVGSGVFLGPAMVGCSNMPVKIRCSPPLRWAMSFAASKTITSWGTSSTSLSMIKRPDARGGRSDLEQGRARERLACLCVGDTHRTASLRHVQLQQGERQLVL